MPTIADGSNLLPLRNPSLMGLECARRGNEQPIVLIQDRDGLTDAVKSRDFRFR